MSTFLIGLGLACGPGASGADKNERTQESGEGSGPGDSGDEGDRSGDQDDGTSDPEDGDGGAENQSTGDDGTSDSSDSTSGDGANDSCAEDDCESGSSSIGDEESGETSQDTGATETSDTGDLPHDFELSLRIEGEIGQTWVAALGMASPYDYADIRALGQSPVESHETRILISAPEASEIEALDPIVDDIGDGAFLVPYIFSDENEDGRWQPGEPMIAGYDHALLYLVDRSPHWFELENNTGQVTEVSATLDLTRIDGRAPTPSLQLGGAVNTLPPDASLFVMLSFNESPTLEILNDAPRTLQYPLPNMGESWMTTVYGEPHPDRRYMGQRGLLPGFTNHGFDLPYIVQDSGEAQGQVDGLDVVLGAPCSPQGNGFLLLWLDPTTWIQRATASFSVVYFDLHPGWNIAESKDNTWRRLPDEELLQLTAGDACPKAERSMSTLKTWPHYDFEAGRSQ